MMKQLHLKGRLSLCAEYVREGSRLADIGTDHGYLPIALCSCGKCPSAIACDINPLPLNSARENIARHALTDRITARLGDGLGPVAADEADDVVIAGMGGELIAAILSSCPWAKDAQKCYILQPMTRHEALIRYLYANGYLIERQGAVLDSGKYYTVIRAVWDGKMRECDPVAAVIGRLTPDGEASVGFLNKCLRQLKKQSAGDPDLIPTIERIEAMLNDHP